MSNNTRIELDTAKLDAGLRQLLSGIDIDGAGAARKAANTVAARLRDLIPVDTGALRSTVHTSSITKGAAVHYGSDLPYRWYIANRTNCIERATAGAENLFQLAASEVAAKEVRQL